MRSFAPFVLAVAAVLSLPGTGQGQLVEQPDAGFAYASDDAGLPAEPAPAVPRVWYPGSQTMMNGYPPGGQYGMYGGTQMVSGYYSPEYGGGYVSDASDYSADAYYQGGQDGYGEYVEGYGDGYVGDCPDCYGAGCDACGDADEHFWLFDSIPFRGYGRFEYLYWSPRGYDVPALVTTSPQGTAQAVAGRLGQPTTNVVFGNEEISDEWRSGGRATFGIWLVPNQLVALEASYFRLENAGASFQATSNFSGGASADPLLARPFFNVDNNMQDAVLLGFPNFIVGAQAVNLDGAVNIESRAMIESAELVRRDVIWLDVFDGHHHQSFLRICCMAGYRYFNMDEELRIDDALVPVGGPFAPGTRIDTTDLFETDNEFHGGQIGLTAEYAQGPWAVELLAKCALGNSHEEVAVRGNTRSFDGVTATNFAGGLLAQPTNIGRESRDLFAVIPEAGINLSLQVTRNLKLSAGYSFIYYSNVVRPGDQIDFGVNPTQFSGGALVGQPRPGRLFEDSEYWIHGGNAGVEVCW